MALMAFYRLQNKKLSGVLDIYKRCAGKLSLKLSSALVIYNYFIHYLSKANENSI